MHVDEVSINYIRISSPIIWKQKHAMGGRPGRKGSFPSAGLRVPKQHQHRYSAVCYPSTDTISLMYP